MASIRTMRPSSLLLPVVSLQHRYFQAVEMRSVRAHFLSYDYTSESHLAGQAFMFKLRKTADRTPSSMVLEPPHSLNGSSNSEDPLRWRHLK